MKKATVFIFILIFLSGCATYKFQKGQAPYDKGYVVSKDGRSVPEYTLGRNNSVPEDLETAKERFKRRKSSVEEYYQKMGLMKSRFQEMVIEPPVMMFKFIGGIFQLPFIAYSNYKYEHDAKYRLGVMKDEEVRFNAERSRIKGLREELKAYVDREIDAEQPNFKVAPVEVKPAEERVSAVSAQEEWLSGQTEELGAKTEAAEEKIEASKKRIEAPPKKEKKAVIRKEKKIKIAKEKPISRQVRSQQITGQPVSVILARPAKGFSPLKVKLYGSQSRSPGARIISYEWDFGDGDKSTKENPVNTYYSATFEPRIFTATLTVTDSKGGSASSSVEIEVLNK